MTHDSQNRYVVDGCQVAGLSGVWDVSGEELDARLAVWSTRIQQQEVGTWAGVRRVGMWAGVRHDEVHGVHSQLEMTICRVRGFDAEEMTAGRVLIHGR
ncbi:MULTISPECIES: hypothetical protein [unclassified Actinobaculum]|uniref:hypothetical protein n=1 Tax=unclassified Actinobaculum TaxID=2609299 RepID=UPI000F7399F2|nr:MULTISPECIES: hypothetical protein [unclassified Actinobaculum]